MPTYLEREKDACIEPGQGTLVGRVAEQHRTVQIRDAWTDAIYEPKDDPRLANIRTRLGLPLLRLGKLIGVIALAREKVEAFTPSQIELVATFADQAVIAKPATTASPATIWPAIGPAVAM